VRGGGVLMADHPIEGLMSTAMESIREMVDVNTIVGEAVQTPDGSVIIPISRVSFGFAAGGGEYRNCCNPERSRYSDDEDESNNSEFPFAGGSGAGVSINPVAFVVVGNGQIKLLPVNVNSSLNKVLDMIPEFLKSIEETIKKAVAATKDMKHGKNAEKNNEKGSIKCKPKEIRIESGETVNGAE